ncbi:ornithine cyclodeaminase family protein [Candidatus Leptofilum sp.]|uniref:ornithine cyclodeaminase family protein n=1 Tax=Candidatus Leptofilum sp. TaxID=3241576 RepID=UPI003B5CF902
MKMRILSAQDVRRALPMAEAIEGMKQAFAQLSTGQAVVPLRGRVDVASQDGTTLVMPAFLAQSNDLAVKVVSIFPKNNARGEPTIYAAVLVLDAETGRPLALMEGGTLTAIRTGAGSGAATDLLARPNASVVAILGSGVQARTQLEAVCTVRNIEEVRVYSPTHENAVTFAREMRGVGPVPDTIRIMSNAETAVRNAEIICTATTSNQPVFNGKDVATGTHINGVGSYTPAMQEVDAETVQRALVVVDEREAAWEEAGDLIQPLQAGLITQDHIHAELGEIVAGLKPGRTDPQQITFFKSVGNAAQDAISGRIALANAIAHNLGTEANL